MGGTKMKSKDLCAGYRGHKYKSKTFLVNAYSAEDLVAVGKDTDVAYQMQSKKVESLTIFCKRCGKVIKDGEEK
jgi:hypothetical protein